MAGGRGEEAVEDDKLVQLVHRRVGDVEKLVTHIKNLEDEACR